jgi:hypothetical protein
VSRGLGLMEIAYGEGGQQVTSRRLGGRGGTDHTEGQVGG